MLYAVSFKIKTYNSIHQSGLDLLPSDTYSISSNEKNPDAIICRSASLHTIDFPPSLKAIARAGAGVNNIPIETCSNNGVVVFNTLGANANAVKELVLASMIISSRNLSKGLQWVNSLDALSPSLDTIVEAQKKEFSGFELQHKTLGVIGLGAIGHKVANLGISLNMKVLGTDPFLSLENALQLSQQVQILKTIEEVLAQSDFISFHVAYSKHTHHLLNHKLLSKANPKVTILNFARKDIVDENAVLDFLYHNKLAQYISDFPSAKTLAHPRVISFPHLGASTQESEENCSRIAAMELKKFLENGTIEGSVNFPHCQLAPTLNTKFRLLVGNNNVANIVAKITQILGKNNINIEDMLNTHKELLAYNIIDIDKKLDESIVQEILSINEVCFSRFIQF